MAGVTRTLSLANIGATGSIPSNAVMLSILLVNATAGNGNFTVWSADQAAPRRTRSCGAAVRGASRPWRSPPSTRPGRINVRANLATDLVIDVVGLYR